MGLAILQPQETLVVVAEETMLQVLVAEVEKAVANLVPAVEKRVNWLNNQKF